MFNISSHLNHMNNTILFLKLPRLKSLTTSNVDEDTEGLELSYTIDINIKLYNRFGKLFDNFLKS